MRRSEALRIFGFPENIQNPDEKELTRRYRKLAREKHPDKGGNPEEFLRIKQAYDILQGEEDPDSNIRHAPTQMDEMFEQVFGGFDEIFSKFKGEEPKKVTKRRIKLSVNELFHGAVREMELEKTKPCDVCMGTGTGSKVQCSDCGGSGIMSFTKKTGRGFGMRTFECTTCKGRGGIGMGSDVPCSACHGHKRVHYMVKKGVDIPKGIPHNARINLEEGWDNPVEIVVQHPTNMDDGWKGWRLNADSRNLEITVPISLEEALIGRSMKIDHPGGGSVEITIESGTQPGTKIIKKDRGLPPCPDAKMPPSSAIIEIQVVIPKIPTEHHENTRRFFEIISRTT